MGKKPREMNALLKVMRNSILLCLLISHQYCFAQTEYNKALLVNKTWKLQSMTHTDGKPYLYKDELPNEVVEFDKDSVYVRRRGNDKLEGKWYFDEQEYLIIQLTKWNGKQAPSGDHKFLSKIKELDSDHLILNNLDREGNDIICTYKSILGN
jgi:hypothetical protein